MDERLVEVLLRIYNEDLEPDEFVRIGFDNKPEYDLFMKYVYELNNYNYIGISPSLLAPNLKDKEKYVAMVTLTEQGIAYCKSLKK